MEKSYIFRNSYLMSRKHIILFIYWYHIGLVSQYTK